MSPEEFKAIRKRMGYTQEKLAGILGYANKVRVSEFERTTNPVQIPRHISMLMQAMDVTGWRPPKIPE